MHIEEWLRDTLAEEFRQTSSAKQTDKNRSNGGLNVGDTAAY